MNFADFILDVTNDACTRLSCTQCNMSADGPTANVVDDPSLLEVAHAAESHARAVHPGEGWKL